MIGVVDCALQAPPAFNPTVLSFYRWHLIMRTGVTSHIFRRGRSGLIDISDIEITVNDMAVFSGRIGILLINQIITQVQYGHS